MTAPAPTRPRAVEKPAAGSPRPVAPLKIKGRPTWIVDDIVDFR